MSQTQVTVQSLYQLNYCENYYIRSIKHKTIRERNRKESRNQSHPTSIPKSLTYEQKWKKVSHL